MEDIYPISGSTILSRVVNQENIGELYQYRSVSSTLCRLAKGLLFDKKAFEEISWACSKYEHDRVGFTSEKEYQLKMFFWFVDKWIKENNFIGNVAKLIEALRSNGRPKFCDEILEKLILEYSLPPTGNVYSYSKDFLIVEESPHCVHQERVLNNPVILDEVFKRLCFNDKKSFRLVSMLWNKETFALWRKYAKINFKVENKMLQDNRNAWKGLNTFLEQAIIWKAGGNVSNDLKNNPFRVYRFNYGLHNELFNCGEEENKFWHDFGADIYELGVTNGVSSENLYDFFKGILNKCRNLKKLVISNARKDWMENENNVQWYEIAENLHTLSLEVAVEEKTIQDIIFLCPNLKNLSIKTKDGLKALCYPVANGELIKLEKLRVDFLGPQDFSSFRNYVEMLNRNKINCLKGLQLINVPLWHARAFKDNFYGALKLCDKITSLELRYDTFAMSERDFSGALQWFTDLSLISFPDLIEFKLSIGESRGYRGYFNKRTPFLFDFNILNGMPKLEKLEIQVKNFAGIERRAGAQDWVYSEEDSILCSKLRQFSFIGWALNEEDIEILSAWFPNLTFINAEVQPELSILLQKWNSLEKLQIQTERLISLRELRPLIQKKEFLKINQIILREEVDRFVELKKHKAWLYFSYLDTQVK